MIKFKKYWEIQNNRQLLIPIMGIIILAYSSFKLSFLFIKETNIAIRLIISCTLFYALLKLTLFIFNKLYNKWQVKHRWEMISIFIVFAATGSSSLFVSRPIIELIGITKENLNTFLYWTLYIIIGFIFYQIMLVLIGWVFGQFQFFWNFEKKMLGRLGFKRLLK